MSAFLDALKMAEAAIAEAAAEIARVRSGDIIGAIEGVPALAAAVHDAFGPALGQVEQLATDLKSGVSAVGLGLRAVGMASTGPNLQNSQEGLGGADNAPGG